MVHLFIDDDKDQRQEERKDRSVRVRQPRSAKPRNNPRGRPTQPSRPPLLTNPRAGSRAAMAGTVPKLAAPRPAAAGPLPSQPLRAAALAFAPSARRFRVSLAGRARSPVIAMASAKEGNGAVTKRTTLHDLYEQQGQSPWYDNLCRPVTDLLPYIANGTVEAAKWLHKVVNRPNVYIKIPATAECVPSIKEVIANGISVNVTLIFSVARYEAVIDAYLDGLEASGLSDLSRVTSVASFFVSRVDSLIDKMLEKIGTPEALAPRGKAAVAQAKIANQLYLKKFSGPRWEALVKKGAKKQRLLWASTSVKNPAYLDTLYVDPLIGPDTVSTMPDQALDAFIDHGTVARTIDANVSEAEGIYSALEKLGIDWEEVGKQLEHEGVSSFKGSFDSLLTSLEEKGNALKTAANL
ncbi:hypothetical protein VPH35_054923 [Triticum aestivum]